MKRFAIGCAALVASFLLPNAAAAEGLIAAADGVEFPESTRLSFSGAESYLSDASSLTELSIVASELHVTRYDYTTVNVGNLQFVTDDTQASYTLTSANATLARTASGAWLGTYASIDTMLAVLVEAPLTVSAAPGARIGNTVTPEQDPDSGRQAFSRSYSTSVLRADARGTISLSGDFSVKITGIDLQVRSRENTSSVSTSVNTEGPTARRQWAFLEVSDGELTFSTPSAVALAGRDGTASWNGEVTLHGASGAMQDGAREYVDLPSLLTITGDLSASLVPIAPRSEGVFLALQGDIASTNAAARMAAPVDQRDAWLLPVGLALVVAAAVGGVVIARRRGGEAAIRADDWLRLADDAASRREFATAAEYLDRAMRRMGKSPRLLIDRAFYLAESGRFDDAVAAYHEACATTANGEPEMLLARLQQSVGRTDAAISALTDALRKEPTYVFDVEGDPILQPLERDPRIATEVERAKRRLRPRG